MNERSLQELVQAEFPKVDESILRDLTHEGYEILSNHCYNDVTISLVELMQILGIDEKVAKHLFDEDDSDVFLSATVLFNDEEFHLTEVSFNDTNIILDPKTYPTFEKFSKIQDAISDLDRQYEDFRERIDAVNDDIFGFIFFHCQ